MSQNKKKNSEDDSLKKINSIKISIIVAAYNIEDYIINCLESCINQTYEDLEIIVVNDGSTDNTGALIQRYESEERFRIIHKINGGLISARIEGINHACGEYFFFLDGDDFLPSDAIEKLIESIGGSEYPDIILGKYQMIHSDGSKVIIDYGFRSGTKVDLINSQFKRRLWNLCGNLYKSHLFKEIVFPEDLYNSIGEDLVTNIQLAYYSNGQLKYTDTLTYNYVKRESSLIGQQKIKEVSIYSFKAFYYAWKFLKQKDIFYFIEDSFMNLSFFFVIGYIKSISKDHNPYNDEIKEVLRFLNSRSKWTLKEKGLKIIAFILISSVSLRTGNIILNVVQK